MVEPEVAPAEDAAPAADLVEAPEPIAEAVVPEVAPASEVIGPIAEAPAPEVVTPEVEEPAEEADDTAGSSAVEVGIAAASATPPEDSGDPSDPRSRDAALVEAVAPEVIEAPPAPIAEESAPAAEVVVPEIEPTPKTAERNHKAEFGAVTGKP